MKLAILSLVKPNWQRFHTYFFLVIRSISFVFHFVTNFIKQLSFFRTVIHLNIDIACVHASPKELVPNGLRVDVPLLIHLPALIVVLLSVVVVPSGENLNSPPIWKIIFENNQLFWLQQWAMIASTGTPTVWQDQSFEKCQCQNFFKTNFFCRYHPIVRWDQNLKLCKLEKISLPKLFSTQSLCSDHIIFWEKEQKNDITVCRYLSFVSLRTEKASAISLNFLSCSAFSSSLASLCLSGWWRTLDLALNSNQLELFW